MSPLVDGPEKADPAKVEPAELMVSRPIKEYAVEGGLDGLKEEKVIGELLEKMM